MIRIFLIGYMGAGKTTIGKALSHKLKIPFIDLDWYIEERFHKTVNEIFTEKGESAFREIERNMLHEVSEFENVIISTGGGTPCFFDNMEYMNSKGTTVYLDVHTEVLFRRLRVATQSRPVLKNKKDEELKEFIDKNINKRLVFYTQAHHTFKADKLDNRWQIEECVNSLQELLKIERKDEKGV